MEMYLIKSLETGTALIVYPVDFAFCGNGWTV